MSRILVVDDHAVNRKLALLVLRKKGHDMLEAADGESALRVARERQPALIVMDVAMPGMDGLATMRLLRADPTITGIRVLALTALAMKGDAKRIFAAGFDEYLSKPFDYHHLVAAAARLLK